MSTESKSIDEKKILRDLMKSVIHKKLYERGIKCEVAGEGEKADILLKSSGITIGKVFIILSDDDDLSFLKGEAENSQVYIAFEKGREKEIISKLLSLGLAGKIKFITWEIKINFQ
ncbi:hypothetical protein HRbin19_00353 [bacterium HR19]|nr:hypothetical protein HRbin19_00353 [bacterium HR19]